MGFTSASVLVTKKRGESNKQFTTFMDETIRDFFPSDMGNIHFDSDFFIDFFLNDKNMDLFCRFTNAILIDHYFNPVSNFLTPSFFCGGEELNGNVVSTLGFGGVDNHSIYNHFIIHPYSGILTPENAEYIYSGAFEFMPYLVPDRYLKKILHYIFILNHQYIDPRDHRKLLKKDFHIVSSPHKLNNPKINRSNRVYVHFIQLPHLVKSNIQDSFLDMVLFISLFTALSADSPHSGTRDYFCSLDPDARRIWEAYESYYHK